MNAEQRILKTLKKRPKTGFTKKELRQLTGVENVGDVIFKLRRKVKIDTIRESGQNRYGESVSFGRYRLGGE